MSQCDPVWRREQSSPSLYARGLCDTWFTLQNAVPTPPVEDYVDVDVDKDSSRTTLLSTTADVISGLPVVRVL